MKQLMIFVMIVVIVFSIYYFTINNQPDQEKQKYELTCTYIDQDSLIVRIRCYPAWRCLPAWSKP